MMKDATPEMTLNLQGGLKEDAEERNMRRKHSETGDTLISDDPENTRREIDFASRSSEVVEISDESDGEDANLDKTWFSLFRVFLAWHCVLPLLSFCCHRVFATRWRLALAQDAVRDASHPFRMHIHFDNFDTFFLKKKKMQGLTRRIVCSCSIRTVIALTSFITLSPKKVEGCRCDAILIDTYSWAQKNSSCMQTITFNKCADQFRNTRILKLRTCKLWEEIQCRTGTRWWSWACQCWTAHIQRRKQQERKQQERRLNEAMAEKRLESKLLTGELKVLNSWTTLWWTGNIHCSRDAAISLITLFFILPFNFIFLDVVDKYPAHFRWGAWHLRREKLLHRFWAQQPLHQRGLCRIQPGVLGRSAVPQWLWLRWRRHRQDAPWCVPKMSRSHWRRRLVVLSVIVSQSRYNGETRCLLTWLTSFERPRNSETHFWEWTD